MRLMSRRASFFFVNVKAGTSEMKMVPYDEQMDKKSAVPRAYGRQQR